MAYFLLILGLHGCDGITGKATLKSLAIAPAYFVMSNKTELRLTAVGRYSDGTEKDVTTEAAWASSDTAIVTIAGAGLAKATAVVNADKVEITAQLDGISGRSVLTVVDIESPPDGSTNNPPRVQIVNYSEYDIDKIKVGRVGYSENLSCCGAGRSAGYFFVTEGANSIVVHRTPESAGERGLGTLNPFLIGNHYTLAIGINALDGLWCAELWRRGNIDVDFINDFTKFLIRKTWGCDRGV